MLVILSDMNLLLQPVTIYLGGGCLWFIIRPAASCASGGLATWWAHDCGHQLLAGPSSLSGERHVNRTDC